jgi:3-hydroxymyristoyl/3-hydroxydecanoyl-(acyl carrier protein) dehydratase
MSGWVLQALVAITGRTDTTVTAAVPVRATEPVLAGHYPGYPVLPGVCVVECAHRVALADRADHDLAAIESARFLAPVHPGDDLTIELAWSADLSCRAEVRTANAVAATIRLRYSAAGTSAVSPPAAAECGLSLDGHEIAELIPHRPPVLLLDRVDSLVPGTSLTATRALRSDEPWCQDGDRPYPAVLLLESWCQAAGVLTVHGAPAAGAGRVLLLGSMQGVELVCPVFPGEVVEHRVRMSQTTGDAAVLTGESFVDGRMVLRVRRIVVALRVAAESEVVA